MALYHSPEYHWKFQFETLQLKKDEQCQIWLEWANKNMIILSFDKNAFLAFIISDRHKEIIIVKAPFKYQTQEDWAGFVTSRELRFFFDLIKWPRFLSNIIYIQTRPEDHQNKHSD